MRCNIAWTASSCPKASASSARHSIPACGLGQTDHRRAAGGIRPRHRRHRRRRHQDAACSIPAARCRSMAAATAKFSRARAMAARPAIGIISSKATICRTISASTRPTADPIRITTTRRNITASPMRRTSSIRHSRIAMIHRHISTTISKFPIRRYPNPRRSAASTSRSPASRRRPAQSLNDQPARDHAFRLGQLSAQRKARSTSRFPLFGRYLESRLFARSEPRRPCLSRHFAERLQKRPGLRRAGGKRLARAPTITRSVSACSCSRTILTATRRRGASRDLHRLGHGIGSLRLRAIVEHALHHRRQRQEDASSFSAYLQDEWKIVQWLTVELRPALRSVTRPSARQSGQPAPQLRRDSRSTARRFMRVMRAISRRRPSSWSASEVGFKIRQ